MYVDVVKEREVMFAGVLSWKRKVQELKNTMVCMFAQHFKSGLITMKYHFLDQLC